MTPLHITVDLSREPWPEVSDLSRPQGSIRRIGLLPNRTGGIGAPGGAVVGLLVDLPKRMTPSYVQLSYRWFATSARIFAMTATGVLLAEELGWTS